MHSILIHCFFYFKIITCKYFNYSTYLQYYFLNIMIMIEIILFLMLFKQSFIELKKQNKQNFKISQAFI